MKKFNEVILVEDDMIQVFLTSKFIERTGLVNKVTTFGNGKEAFEAMKDRSENGQPFPDIILLDINMPIWDGWEFYDAFIQLPDSKKVLMYILTSSVSEFDLNKAKDAGLAEKYLSKPMSYDTLNALLTDL